MNRFKGFGPLGTSRLLSSICLNIDNIFFAVCDFPASSIDSSSPFLPFLAMNGSLNISVSCSVCEKE